MESWFNRNIGKIRSWLPRQSPEEIVETDEDPGPSFIAREDFNPGDRLIFMGDSLFRWRKEYRIPAAFVARREIRAGELVRHDLFDQRLSDVAIIWWNEGRVRKNE